MQMMIAVLRQNFDFWIALIVVTMKLLLQQRIGVARMAVHDWPAP